jgi:hypothetical protein
MSNFFCVCYLDNILKKYLYVVSSFCFCVVFVLLLLHLSVCLYLYDLFHIQLLQLQTCGSMECMYMCVCPSSMLEGVKLILHLCWEMLLQVTNEKIILPILSS